MSDEAVPTDGRRKRGRRGVALVAFLALLGLGAGVGMRYWAASRATIGAGDAVAGTPFKGATLSPAAATLWARLLEALGTQGERPLTIARLAELLSWHRDDPAARAFAEDFKRDSRLMGLWDQWLHSQDALDPGWLPRELARCPTFAELLNKHSGEPGFAVLGESLGRGIGAAKGTGGQAPSAPRGPAEPAAPAPTQASRDPVGVPGPGGPQALGTALAGARASSVGPGGAGVARSVPAAGNEPSMDRIAGRGSDLPATETPGEGALTLKPIEGAGRDVVTGSDFFSRCYRADSGISRDECKRVADALGPYDLWGACFAAGLFDRCRDLCAQPGMSCGTGAFDTTCLQVKSPDECRALCAARPECLALGGTTGGQSEGDAGGAAGGTVDEGAGAVGGPAAPTPCVRVTNYRVQDGHAQVSWTAGCDPAGIAWCKAYIGGVFYTWAGESGGPQDWITDGRRVDFECQGNSGGRGRDGD